MTNGDNRSQIVSKRDELLTLGEVALYLKVAEKTVLRMIQRKEIPCVRIGGQWRFPYSIIEHWVYSKIKGVHNTGLLELIESDTDIVPISRLTRDHLIQLHIAPGTKKEILTQLIHPLSKEEIVTEPHLYLNKLIQREKMASTALSFGAAFPHVREPGENTSSKPYIVFGICEEGTDFESLDGQKTYLFCLLYVQSIVAHLRILSRLIQLCRIKDAVHLLSTSKTRKDFISNLITLEQKCPRHDSNV